MIIVKLLTKKRQLVDRLHEADVHLDLIEEGRYEMHIRGRSDLRNHDRVQMLPGAFDKELGLDKANLA